MTTLRPAALPPRTTRSLRPLRSRRRKGSGLAWGLLSPYLALLLAFAIVPTLSALWASLGGGSDLGLQTMARAFGNISFLPALLNVASFIVVFLPALLVIATAVALLLHAKAGRAVTVFKLVYYLPGVVVGAPLVLLWLFMLAPQLSPFQGALNAFGFETASQVFTSANMPFIFAIMAIYSSVGGWIVLLCSSLDAIDTEVLEAARIDGAGAWQTAWHIKLPLVSRYIAFIGILSFAGATQLVAEPTLVGTALPGTVSSTWSLNQLTFAYAFAQNDTAAASVYAVFLVAVGVGAALFLIYGLRSYAETEEK